MAKSKLNTGLAIGVIGVLVLMGSDAYAGETAKGKPGRTPATTSSAPIGKALDASAPKLTRASGAPRAGYFKNVQGLTYETGVVESSKPPRRNLVTLPAGPQAGDPVARWNFTHAWPQSTPAPAPRNNGRFDGVVLLSGSVPGGAVPGVLQPTGYQIVSAGKDGGPSPATQDSNSDGNTIYVSNQWIPSANEPAKTPGEKPAKQASEAQPREGVVGDLNEFQQVEVNR